MSDTDLPKGAPGRTPGAGQPIPAGTLVNGMMVCFDKCTKSNARKSTVFSFRGKGFGILLGVIPQFGRDPNREQIIQLLAGVGFVLLDDVADFLGDDQAQKFTDKFHEKYEPKADEAPPLEEPPKSNLIGLDGEPLSKPPEPEAIPIAAKTDA